MPEPLPAIEGNYTYPFAVNNTGIIVGNTLDLVSTVFAIRWVDSKLEWLDKGNFASTLATAINDAGTIVGTGYDSNNESTPIVWEDGVLTRLPTLGGRGFAADINAAGEIVGWVDTPNGPTVPAVWRKGELTVLPSYFNNGGEATAIDDEGRIYGTSLGLENGDRIPSQWINDNVTALPITFGPDYIGVLGVTRARANQVSGYVIQREFLEDGSPYLVAVATGWQDGKYRELPRPTGRGNSRAFGINRDGIYAGSTEDEIGYTVPTLWDKDGPTLLPIQEGRSANAINLNDNGLVVGTDNTDGRNPIPLVWRRNTAPALRMANLRATAGSTVTLQAIATTGKQPLADRKVEYRLNGTVIGTANTNSRGVATLRYQLPKSARGRMQVTVAMGNRTTVTRNLMLGRGTATAAIAPVQAIPNRTVRLTANLRNAELNTPLNGRNVAFVIGNRVVARALTDRNGVARVTYRIPARLSESRVPIEVRYFGDAEASPKTGRASLYQLP